MKDSMKTLFDIYYQDIITESIFDKITEKVTSVFNCFNNVTKLSDNISTGNFDGDCKSLSQNGKSALGQVTNKISILKKPTDGLVNVGTEKVGPLFNGPLTVAKNGGDMNKAVSKMLNETKTAFGNGAQDALKGTSKTVSQSAERLINKKFHLFMQSRCFRKKQSRTRIHIQNAFKHLIQEHVINANNPKSFYYKLNKPLIIQTTDSNIKIGINKQNKVIYEQNNKYKFSTPIIITEGVIQQERSFMNKLLCSSLGLSKTSNVPQIMDKISKTYNIDKSQVQRYFTNQDGSFIGLSNGGIPRLKKQHPEIFNKLFNGKSVAQVKRYNSDWNIFDKATQKAGKDSLGRERGSLLRDMQARRTRLSNKINKKVKAVKAKGKQFGSKVWGIIKKIYRPLYNLLVYIAALIIRLILTIARFIINLLAKPILRLVMPSAGQATIEATINKWLTKMSDIKISFTLTQDIKAQIDKTGIIISRLLKWTAFAGCTGITIWIVSNISNFFGGNKESQDDKSQQNMILDPNQE